MDFNFGEYLVDKISQYSGNVISSAGKALNKYEVIGCMNNASSSFEDLDVEPGSVALVIVDEEIMILPLLLALFKSRIVYVPISRATPATRLRKIIDDCNPSIILGNNPGLIFEGFKNYGTVLEYSVQINFNKNNINLLKEDILYTIFTSGTTGAPKGIMMSQRAVFHSLEGYSDMFFNEGEVVGTTSPFNFDFSIFDFLISIWCLSEINVVPKVYSLKAKSLIRYLENNNITRLHTVPSFLNAVISSFSRNGESNQLKKILYAGESFSKNSLDKLSKVFPNVRFIQSFGHTESMGCSFKILPPDIEFVDGRVSIGKPLLNTEMYLVNNGSVVNESHKYGELYIEGQHIFSGYINNEEETESKLVGCLLNKDKRVFRSGDICFRDDKGEYYFVGRADGQVKLAGNRIELSEIAMSISELGYESVSSLQSGEGPFIITYIQIHDTDTSACMVRKQVLNHLADSLPAYMIPKKIKCVLRFPLNSNGKIDVAAIKNGEIEDVK